VVVCELLRARSNDDGIPSFLGSDIAAEAAVKSRSYSNISEAKGTFNRTHGSYP